jgi:hypothetical protein
LGLRRRRAAPPLKPNPKISFQDASPAGRQINDHRAFAACNQTLNRPAGNANDRGGFTQAVDDK